MEELKWILTLGYLLMASTLVLAFIYTNYSNKESSDKKNEIIPAKYYVDGIKDSLDWVIWAEQTNLISPIERENKISKLSNIIINKKIPIDEIRLSSLFLKMWREGLLHTKEKNLLMTSVDPKRKIFYLNSITDIEKNLLFNGFEKENNGGLT